MPPFLRAVMQVSPSTHFVSFAQAILYRGAGLDVVWPQFLAVAVIGSLFPGRLHLSLSARGRPGELRQVDSRSGRH